MAVSCNSAKMKKKVAKSQSSFLYQKVKPWKPWLSSRPSSNWNYQYYHVLLVTPRMAPNWLLRMAPSAPSLRLVRIISHLIRLTRRKIHTILPSKQPKLSIRRKSTPFSPTGVILRLLTAHLVPILRAQPLNQPVAKAVPDQIMPKSQKIVIQNLSPGKKLKKFF